MEHKDLCIPVDPHDYEHDTEPEPSDEFVSLAEGGRDTKAGRARLDETLIEHPGD
jgi:hypothetical protein